LHHHPTLANAALVGSIAAVRAMGRYAGAVSQRVRNVFSADGARKVNINPIKTEWPHVKAPLGFSGRGGGWLHGCRSVDVFALIGLCRAMEGGSTADNQAGCSAHLAASGAPFALEFKDPMQIVRRVAELLKISLSRCESSQFP
jgi:hypothetical protein